MATAKKKTAKKTTKKKTTKKKTAKKKTAKKKTAKKKTAKKVDSDFPKLLMKKLVETVNFYYIKGPDFRCIHIDGAIGGLTTKGFLHMALYSERVAIPQQTTHKINPDGQLGEEDQEKRVSKDGVVRQMEIDIIFNEETAKDLRNWLDQKLVDFDERRKEIKILKKGIKK